MRNVSLARPGGTVVPVPVCRPASRLSLSVSHYFPETNRCRAVVQRSAGDLLHMACRLSTSGSYTVVVIPLRTSLHSQEALRFYQWMKRMKDLEKEKDALWSGLEILDRGRLWYLQRLAENRAVRRVESRYGAAAFHKHTAEAPSCLLTHIQRVNGSLGSVMSEPSSSSSPRLSDALVDSDLRWQNTVLTQKVGEKNRRISALELEKEALLEELEDLQAS